MIDNFTKDDLIRLYRSEKDVRIRERLLMLVHRKEGKSYRKISEILKVPYTTIQFWVKRSEKNGIEGLKRKKITVHRGYLTQQQEIEVREYAKGKTSKEIVEFIEKRYGKRYHLFYIPRFLKRIGLSLIKPRKKHYKSDDIKKQEFKEHIKKHWELVE